MKMRENRSCKNNANWRFQLYVISLYLQHGFVNRAQIVKPYVPLVMFKKSLRTPNKSMGGGGCTPPALFLQT